MYERSIFQNEIIFELESINGGVKINKNVIECITASGPYKNIIGKHILRPGEIYTFSFRILNAFICKIGVIAVKDLVLLKDKNFKRSFTSLSSGYGLFSNGQTRVNSECKT